MKDEKRAWCRYGAGVKKKPLCKCASNTETIGICIKKNMIIDFELWILARFSSSIYFSETKWYSKPGPCALSLPIIVAKCECDERCKFGLFKGRSGKFPTTLAFPASFYKGLDEFEADLDPKQIEKLLVFFEVISTQEKISKVKDTTQKQEERKLYFASIL